jgi:hypothetical protein
MSSSTHPHHAGETSRILHFLTIANSPRGCLLRAGPWPVDSRGHRCGPSRPEAVIDRIFPAGAFEDHPGDEIARRSPPPGGGRGPPPNPDPRASTPRHSPSRFALSEPTGTWSRSLRPAEARARGLAEGEADRDQEVRAAVVVARQEETRGREVGQFLSDERVKNAALKTSLSARSCTEMTFLTGTAGSFVPGLHKHVGEFAPWPSFASDPRCQHLSDIAQARGGDVHGAPLPPCCSDQPQEGTNSVCTSMPLAPIPRRARRTPPGFPLDHPTSPLWG